MQGIAGSLQIERMVSPCDNLSQIVSAISCEKVVGRPVLLFGFVAMFHKVSVKIVLTRILIFPLILPRCYLDVRAFFFFRLDFRLDKDDFDALRVVVWDEVRVADLVDERLATAREVVWIK